MHDTSQYSILVLQFNNFKQKYLKFLHNNDNVIRKTSAHNLVTMETGFKVDSQKKHCRFSRYIIKK